MKQGSKSISVLLIFILALGYCYSMLPLEISSMEDSQSIDSATDSEILKPAAAQFLSDSFELPPIWTHNTTTELWIRPVAISDDGSTLVEGALDTITLLNQTNGDVIWSYNTSSTVMDVAISANGSWIVAGTISNETYLFEKTSSVPYWISKGNHYIPAVDISGDGKTIVCGDWVGGVYVFDQTDNTSLWEYATGDRITEVCVSHNGSVISIVGLHDTVFAFNRNSPILLWSYTTSDDLISVSVSDDGDIIAAAGFSGVFIFGSSTNDTIWIYDISGFQCVDVAADGSTIAAGRSNVNDENLFLWSALSNDTIWTFNNTNQIRSVSVSSDGQWIAAGSYDNRTYLFDRTSNQTIFTYLSSGTIVSSDMSSDGQKIVSSCSQGLTHFFKIEAPERPTIVKHSRIYHNTSETINFTVDAQSGSFPLSNCTLYYQLDFGDIQSVSLINMTLLNESLVTFSGSIGPLSEGTVQFYAIVNDTYSFSNQSLTGQLVVDGTNPSIESVLFTPTSPSSSEEVTIIASVEDARSGVDSVIVYYSIDDATSWIALLPVSIDGASYNFTISSMTNGTVVQFYIIASDLVGNTVIDDNGGEYYNYLVQDTAGTTTPTTPSTTTGIEIPEDPLLIVGVVAVVCIASLIVIYYFHTRKEKLASKTPVTITKTDQGGDNSPTEQGLLKEEAIDEN